MRSRLEDARSAMRTAGVELSPSSFSALGDRYLLTRAATEALAAPLSAEDQNLQSMAEASPTKWHRAHTTWFFETFILLPHCPGYRAFNPAYAYLFNSYYEALGPRHARPMRGILSRPGVEEIGAYRAHVDTAMAIFLESTLSKTYEHLIELGLQHEAQHQELIVTDIKHAFSLNPLKPAYTQNSQSEDSPPPALEWLPIPGGIYEVGHSTAGFCFDNEGPVHRVLLRDFKIANRPVSNTEYLMFIEDGGYQRPEFWLSDGWAQVQEQAWQAPAYWIRENEIWRLYTLYGMQPLPLHQAVCHLSFYEAAAYAAWAGKRLPSEFEWECAARQHGCIDSRSAASVQPGTLTNGFSQDVWEWTGSAYLPYPGYCASADALGEYNGKFMVNQMVLRGRSCATPPHHSRVSYRNFFHPGARWQFSGFRLAEDV